ncbi:MAG: tetratricopeptide repeat protein [Betaproteobacteria bacterium]|nr:tetratricopeptide repeat protein [Betaproteobacteria bacterium]
MSRRAQTAETCDSTFAGVASPGVAGLLQGVLCLFFVLPAHAGPWLDQMQGGVASWQARDYAAAGRQFSAALLLAGNERERADALYNLGGAHYAQGRWGVAVEAYQTVLRARPGDPRASANLAEAQRQAARFRNSNPAASDLRGRRGQLMQGVVNLDWERESAVKELATKPGGTLTDRTQADAAQLNAQAAAQAQVAADARRLQSGLRKLEWLQERPRTLLRGLLQQDRGAAAQEGNPW